jgi:threonine dehydratase
MISLMDIQEAHKRIQGIINKTPVMTSTTIDSMTGCKVFFKCENYQKVGAFKFRGAVNAVSQLDDEEKKKGVITHSSGNHAQALSLAASKLGIDCTIVMPKTSPQVKIEATKGYGAKVILCEPTLESRKSTTDELIAQHGYTLVHPYDNERIIAGAGTAAKELIDEVGCIDLMLAPIGGGGLMSGTSVATKGLCPEARVIACEPSGADDAFRSYTDNTLYPSVDPRTIADGLLTSLSPLTFSIVKEYVDEIVTVSDEEILYAMRLLWERMKMVVEPSGAVSLAGILKKREDFEGKRIGVILSGGNIDLEDFFSSLKERVDTIGLGVI